MEKREIRKDRTWVRNFVTVYVIIAVVLSLSFYLLYRTQYANHLEDIKTDETLTVRLQFNAVVNHFSHIISDLEIIGGQNELKELLKKDTAKNRHRLAIELSDFVRERNAYDQIRFLDDEGMEIVRINDDNNEPHVVPKEELQLKASRYYFLESIKLNKGELYISPMDLNVEKGKVEVPFKPMIRFGIPIFNDNGAKRGVLLINYIGAQIIKSLRTFSETTPGNVLLVNQDKYLMASPDKDEEWAFMFPDKKDKTFDQKYPGIWDEIKSNSDGQILNQYGLFTYRTAYPISYCKTDSVMPMVENDDIEIQSENGYFWKIISHVKPEDLVGYTNIQVIYIIMTFLYLLTIIPAFIIASLLARKRMLHEELVYSANYDLLTGLPNRSLFYDRMNQVFSYSQRYENKFAVMFLDLDDFKVVNDTLGHDAGDMLLVQVAERLSGIIRKSDTLARLGGDEFTIILQNVPEISGVEKVAKMIIDELCNPFDLHGEEVMIGVSIGISIFPDNGGTVESIVNKADHAMYVSKSKGKNRFNFA